MLLITVIFFLFALPITFKHLPAILANWRDPVCWRLANVMPISEKGQKQDPGNVRPVNLTSVPEKVMEKSTWSAIM